MKKIESVEQLNILVKENKPFVIKCFSPNCGPCKALQILIDEIRNTLEDTLKGVQFFSCDVT